LNTVPVPNLYVLNTASLVKPHALQQLQTEVLNLSIDIAFISETHFKKQHLSSTFQIPGYTLHRVDRKGRRGGGVALLIHNSITTIQWTPLCPQGAFETLWIKADYQGKTFVCCVMYHPPRPIYTTEDLLSYLQNSFDELHQDSTMFPSVFNIILAGDFNSLKDSDIADRTGLIPIVKEPTRGQAYLDKVFVMNKDNMKVNVCKSLVKSDHQAVIVHGVNSQKLPSLKKDKRVCIYR